MSHKFIPDPNQPGAGVYLRDGVDPATLDKAQTATIRFADPQVQAALFAEWLKLPFRRRMGFVFWQEATPYLPPLTPYMAFIPPDKGLPMDPFIGFCLPQDLRWAMADKGATPLIDWLFKDSQLGKTDLGSILQVDESLHGKLPVRVKYLHHACGVALTLGQYWMLASLSKLLQQMGLLDKRDCKYLDFDGLDSREELTMQPMGPVALDEPDREVKALMHRSADGIWRKSATLQRAAVLLVRGRFGSEAGRAIGSIKDFTLSGEVVLLHDQCLNAGVAAIRKAMPADLLQGLREGVIDSVSLFEQLNQRAMGNAAPGSSPLPSDLAGQHPSDKEGTGRVARLRRPRLVLPAHDVPAIGWDDVRGDDSPTWAVVNPDQQAVNQPVYAVPARGEGMAPGEGGGQGPAPSPEQSPRQYDGVAAADIPYVAPKMVRVLPEVFEYFQHCAARARWQVCDQHGWQFTFTPLSVEKDDPADCFHVVAVQRVVRLFATPADQRVYYDPKVAWKDKPEPLCYVVPADWQAAVEQLWALGRVIGAMGHTIAHTTTQPAKPGTSSAA